MTFKMKTLPLAAAALIATSVAAGAQGWHSNSGTQNVNPLETEQGSTTTERLARLKGIAAQSGAGVMAPSMETTGSIAVSPAPTYRGDSGLYGSNDRALVNPTETESNSITTEEIR